MNHYDVVIVGAGVVGLTFAALLKESKLRVAIVDKQLPLTEWNDAQYDLRVSAITLAAQQTFKKIGVWLDIQAQSVSPFYKMHVWDVSGGGAIDFDSADIGGPTLGYVIENRVIQKSLYQCLQQCSHVEFVGSAELQAMEFKDSQVILRLSNNDKLVAKLVVGADGAQSQVRRLANIEVTSRDYEHTALVAMVHTELSHQKTAWQCFLPNGPLAFLPLADLHCSSIVWSTTPAEAAQLRELPANEFCKKLQAAFSYRLGHVTSTSERIIFPLQMRHVKNYVKSQLVLIGDAAHTIHPLAGQGVNLGIADASDLAEVILTAYAKKRDWSALHTLRKYERARKGENMAMIAAMGGFKWLFTSNNPLLGWIRNVGLSTTNELGFLKNYFMKYAAGVERG